MQTLYLLKKNLLFKKKIVHVYWMARVLFSGGEMVSKID